MNNLHQILRKCRIFALLSLSSEHEASVKAYIACFWQIVKVAKQQNIVFFPKNANCVAVVFEIMIVGSF